MEYKYKNTRNVIHQGMNPGEIKVFDHEILGSGVQLIINEKKNENKTIKGDNK